MTAAAEERPGQALPPPILRFRIDEAIPELAVVGRPQGHHLKLWMNKPAAIQLAHALLDVAASMPSASGGVAILQWGGLKMPRNAEVAVESAPDSPTRTSPILSADGAQIIRAVD